jgi:preprotein translocase subunit SecE
MSSVEQIKSAPARTTGDGGGIVGRWNNTRTFLGEVRNEMRRVTWPARREVYATTVVVILTAMFFGLYLSGLDLLFDRIVRWIYQMSGVL